MSCYPSAPQTEQGWGGWTLTIELLARHDVLNENWRFLQRGLSSLHESIYRLQRG